MKFIKLLRPLNLTFLGSSISLVYFILLPELSKDVQISNLLFWTFLLSCLFMAAGGNIINDCHDVEIDKVNRPGRPLVNASIFQRKTAYSIGLMLLLISLILGFFIGYQLEQSSYGFFYFFAALTFVAYSQKLKRQALFGNLLVSLLTVLPYFLLFYLIELNSQVQMSLLVFRIFIFLMIMSFLLNFIREIIKDLEDMQGDHYANCKTLPIIIGRERTHFIVQVMIVISLLSLVICSLYFFDTYLMAIFFGLGVGLPLFLVAFKVRKVRMATNYHLLSQLLKLSMLIGLILLILLPQILRI